MSARNRACVFLLGACAAWNAGNVGPIAGRLESEFDVSLSVIGLLSGTFFFAGVVAASLAGAELSRRIPIARGLRAACVLLFAGNLLAAATPVLGGLIGARIVVGFGAGLIFLFGGGFSRTEGGLRALGLFGAGITLGVAFALGIGGLLEEADVDWRATFGLAALLGLVPLALIPGEVPSGAPRTEPSDGLMREAARRLSFWRLQLLSISSLGVPLVIGAWLISYLVAEEGMGAGEAGAASFVLFAISAAMRYSGGVVAARGVSQSLIAFGGCAVGAAGVAVLALGDGTGAALAGIVLMGLGLSFPASLVYDEGETVLPGRPLGGLGLIVMGASAFPIAVIPLFGIALGEGDGEVAFLALAAFVLVAGLANIVPASASSASPTPANAPPG